MTTATTEGLYGTVTGLLKGEVAADNFATARILPHARLDSASGQYLVRTTPLRAETTQLNFRKQAPGGSRAFTFVDYDRVNVTLDHYQSDLGLVHDSTIRLFNSGGSVDLLTDVARKIGESVKAVVDSEARALVAALSGSFSLDLTSASTNIAAIVLAEATAIELRTGYRPTVMMVGPAVIDKMWYNTDVRAQAPMSANVAPGSTSRPLRRQAVIDWFMIATGIELVENRMSATTSGTAGFAWTTTAVLGRFDTDTSAFHLYGPEAAQDGGAVFPVQGERVGAANGGPGEVVYVDADMKIAATWAALASKCTVTLA